MNLVIPQEVKKDLVQVANNWPKAVQDYLNLLERINDEYYIYPDVKDELFNLKGRVWYYQQKAKQTQHQVDILLEKLK